MKLSQLSLADYNQLDSIPVINQDLSASGFTPVANTYYRHTGATTATFTQGVIYLYDTAYHKLGESGGTTLNKYTFSGTSATILNRIVANAKSIFKVSINNYNVVMASQPGYDNGNTFYSINFYSTYIEIRMFITQSASKMTSYAEIKTDGTVNIVPSASTTFDIKIEYWNDTEIT